MLTEWQREAFNHHRGQIENADSLGEIETAAGEVFRQDYNHWLIGGLAPIYKKNLTRLRESLEPETIVIIDAMNWIFADWSVDRSPSSACKKFGTRLRKVKAIFNAKWVVVAGESDEPLLRKEWFPEYKSSRLPHDDGIEQTVSLVKQGCSDLGVPFISERKHEADDVMATLATRAAIRGDHAVICTTDRDSCQILKSDMVSIFKKGNKFTEEDYKNETGLDPKQHIDYVSIVGKDDVPGWSGIGDKTARELLMKHGSFMGIWDHASELTEAKQRSLQEFAERFFLAKRMHTVNRWLEFAFDWDNAA